MLKEGASIAHIAADLHVSKRAIFLPKTSRMMASRQHHAN